MRRFDGNDYVRVVDDKRLSRQMDLVRDLMIDGKWRTLSEIAAEIRQPEASVSAQLRHLRKERFGSYRVDKQRRGDPRQGLFEYCLTKPVMKEVQGEWFA